MGDLARLPVPEKSSLALEIMVVKAIHLAIYKDTQIETSYDIVVPLAWESGKTGQVSCLQKLIILEEQIDQEVYALYSLKEEDRFEITSELEIGSEIETDDNDREASEDNDGEIEASINQEELAVRWISYAVGIVLGRFQPGILRGLGNAVYSRKRFAIGKLPLPYYKDFDDLVGSKEHFAYIDEQKGRHVFKRS